MFTAYRQIKKNVFILKKDGETVTYYQSYYLLFAKMHEALPYSVKKVGNPIWVTSDVAAVTYQDSLGHLHIYLGTYGYRGGDADSYEYVTSLTRGTWENTEEKFILQNKLGIIKISDQKKIETYSDDHIVQFGTSGVVLTNETAAKYACVIPKNARYGVDDDTPNNSSDVKLLVFKPSLSKMRVIKLGYSGGE